MNLSGLLVLFALLLGNILISVYVFTNGFLIRRLSLNHSSTHAHADLKQFNRTVILFIDALRFDFIFTNQQQLFGIPTIQKLLTSQPANSKLFKFIADPPTTTMQRIKALMTGTLPTFIDAGSNFDSYMIEDDNLIQQTFTNNKSVIILGDDTWLSLFNATMLQQEHTYPSFNIKDLDTNDLNVDEKLKGILMSKDVVWNLMIGHYLGLDHCGHTFGPKSPVIRRKLNDVDRTIRFVSDLIEEDTLLVVIGDHGMTETGDHGGDSRLELESALFFYSKKPLHGSPDTVYKEVRQINLTPTLALLLGLPIPYSNLGIVIGEMFEKRLEAFHANYIQIKEFIENYEALTNEIFTDKSSSLDVTDLGQLQNYLVQVQEKCREKWSTFNLNYCIAGLFLIAFSILNLVLFLLGGQFNQQLTLQVLKPAGLFSAISILISPSQVLLPFIAACLNICLLHRLASNFRNFQIDSLLKPEYFFYTLVLFIPFSNSFIVQENVSLRFIVVSVVCYEFYKRLQLESHVTGRFFLSKCRDLATLVTLIRITELFYVCREEALLLKCTQGIFSTQISKTSDFSILVYFAFSFLNLVVMSSVLFSLLRPYLTRSCINFVILLKVLTLFAYWLVQIRISQSSAEHRFFFNQIGLYLARLFYTLFAVSQLFIWTFDDRCYLKLVTYVLATFGLLTSILSGESVASIWILVLVLTSYARHRSAWSSEIKVIDFNLVLVLLQQYFFYATGHETSFTHIKWEAGFHGFESENSNPVIRVFVMIFILINTYSSALVVAIGGIGLLNHNDLFIDEKKPSYRKFIRSTLGFYTFYSVKVLSSAVSVFVLRRHLMVWKIFAPRFVFEIVGFFFSCILCFLATLIFNRA